jgi:hypothetical protein
MSKQFESSFPRRNKKQKTTTGARQAVALARYLPHAIAIAVTIATPAFAADQPLPALFGPPTAASVPDLEYFVPQPIPAWQAELGARYWLGKTTTGKSLFAPTSVSDAMVSRLTYKDITTNTGELFGRVGFTGGFFAKGYVGFGSASQGSLQDEDFPPIPLPFAPFVDNHYSSTNSEQHNGNLAYASADLGYDFVRGGDFRLGAFAGYHYFHEIVNAFGCQQEAGDAYICQPTVPTDYEVITQSNTWQSVRVGLEGAVKFGSRFMLTAEGAWLPYVYLNGYDTHWLRLGSGLDDFTGAIPETGHGQGYQLESVLSYQVSQAVGIGVGARYWHMYANGDSHFEDVVAGGQPQPVNWKSDIFGVFLQASIKLGPYPLGLNGASAF